MDRVTELHQVVEREVADYVRESPNATLYFLTDKRNPLFTTIAVPQARGERSLVVVMAKIENDQVIILADITDRPLVDELVRAGIRREQIVLAYAGEVPRPPVHA
jgi:hypothetical protein